MYAFWVELAPSWGRTVLATLVRMTGELTDLDQAVIEELTARYARSGEAAFDEAVSRLVIAVCAVLAYTRGTARLHDLINLVEAVCAKRAGESLH